jgi:hypothetical protein
MEVGTRSVVVIMISMMLAGCSMRVPAETVCGTYVASYPFGTETIILNPDGTFVQRVAIGQEQPLTVRGTWDFDPRRSRADFYGSVVVADGFDQLRSDWKTVSPGVASLDVERHWFRVVMNSAARSPYLKQ